MHRAAVAVAPAYPNILAGCNKTKQVPSFRQQCGVRGISVKIGTLRAAAFCGALGIFVSATTLGPAKAATLLADGTYSTPGDLTRIDNGGTVLEFLDLTLTDGGFNEAGALATFPGFHLGTQAEVSALFSAFGIVYPLVLNPGDVVDLGAPANAASFVSHLGATNLGTGSLGFFDGPGFGDSYFCISTANCGPLNFVTSTFFTVNAANIGFTLVRTGDIGATPLPAALPLFAGGLGVIGLLARRRKRKLIATA
jgi:hypothetical protein